MDGDTIDARVDLGCSVSLDERFRLSDISAPEIFGASRSGPEYARGVSAKALKSSPAEVLRTALAEFLRP